MILILTPSHNSISPGPSICSFFKEYYSACLVAMDDHSFQDSDYMDRLVREYSPNIVINCHEYSDIDGAEYEREHTYAINGFAVKNLSNICRDRDVILIQVSSLFVFNGLSGSPYREDDEPEPATAYGDSKLLGERFIMESGCRHIIIRTSDVFGEEMPFFNRRLISFDDDYTLRMIKGQIIAPAYSVDLAKAISELISRGSEGIYHFSQEGSVTTGGFMTKAMELFSHYGVTAKKYAIIEVEREDFLASCDRPGYTVLDTGKFTKATGSSVRRWESALEDYIAKNGSAIILSNKE